MAEKKSSGKWQVMNVTEGMLASPEVMTKKEADKFIKDFPGRFKNQGYYRTAKGYKLRPEDVVLECIPYKN
jgi:hypothetical protein